MVNIIEKVIVHSNTSVMGEARLGLRLIFRILTYSDPILSTVLILSNDKIRRKEQGVLSGRLSIIPQTAGVLSNHLFQSQHTSLNTAMLGVLK